MSLTTTQLSQLRQRRRKSRKENLLPNQSRNQMRGRNKIKRKSKNHVKTTAKGHLALWKERLTRNCKNNLRKSLSLIRTNLSKLKSQWTQKKRKRPLKRRLKEDSSTSSQTPRFWRLKTCRKIRTNEETTFSKTGLTTWRRTVRPLDKILQKTSARKTFVADVVEAEVAVVAVVGAEISRKETGTTKMATMPVADVEATS